MVSKAAEYTKTTDTKEKKPGRYVFYVNVDQYCKQGWFNQIFMSESRSEKLLRIKAEIARSGFFKPDEEVLIVPSNGTHLEKLWEE